MEDARRFDLTPRPSSGADCRGWQVELLRCPRSRVGEAALFLEPRRSPAATGVVCSTKVLSEAEEALQAGQGGIRCLVSFVIGDKKSLPDIPQFP